MGNYTPVSYKRTCEYCGKEYIAHNVSKRFCSKKCKDIHYRLERGIPCNESLEPISKRCAVCGKTYQSFRERSICCSHECSEKWKKKIQSRQRAPQGKGGRSWAEYVADARKASVERKQKKAEEKELIKAQHIEARECVECGAIFYCLDSVSTKTCSASCSKRYKRKRHDKRIPKDQRIDYISLKRLFVRDNGICYLCGEMCDWEDWKTSKTGHKYPGDKYPVIEHVVPISKGGLDSWENVRLACSKCNAEKSDAVIQIKSLPLDIAYSQKHNRTYAKKTAQYSLSGELIKIWDSTAQIKRELGFNDKRIQSVCRLYKSKTGNAFGFHWEYIGDSQDARAN